MNADLVLEELLGVVHGLEQKGRTTLSTAGLAAWLTRIRDAVGRSAAGDRSLGGARLEAMLEETGSADDPGARTHRHAAASVQPSLRSAIIVNGGAAIAVFAFLGGSSSVLSTVPQFNAMAAALLYFAGGVLAASFATITSYAAHACSREGDVVRVARWTRRTIAVEAISLLLFAAGCWTAYRAVVLR